MPRSEEVEVMIYLPTIYIFLKFAWLLQLLLVTGLNRDLGVSDEWFAMGDSLVLTVLGQVCCELPLSLTNLT